MEAQQKKLLREEAILLHLKKLDYLSRSQIQRLHQLGGDRNARRVLDNMNAYLSCFRGENGENIYYLNKNGRERIGSEVARNKTNQANHYLMRNDAYLHYAGNENWINEAKFGVKELQLTVISDAYFRYKTRRHFLEVDHLQHMQKNREKIERYKKLKSTNALQEQLKYFPKLVWVTMTASRKTQLQEWCGDLEVAIHVWDEINN